MESVAHQTLQCVALGGDKQLIHRDTRDRVANCTTRTKSSLWWFFLTVRSWLVPSGAPLKDPCFIIWFRFNRPSDVRSDHPLAPDLGEEARADSFPSSRGQSPSTIHVPTVHHATFTA